MTLELLLTTWNKSWKFRIRYLSPSKYYIYRIYTSARLHSSSYRLSWGGAVESSVYEENSSRSYETIFLQAIMCLPNILRPWPLIWLIFLHYISFFMKINMALPFHRNEGFYNASSRISINWCNAIVQSRACNSQKISWNMPSKVH